MFAHIRWFRSLSRAASRSGGASLIVVHRLDDTGNTDDTDNARLTVSDSSADSAQVSVEMTKRTEHTARLVRCAFHFAARHGLRRLCAVYPCCSALHENALLHDISLWAKHKYPSIAFRSLSIENACYQLVHEPAQLDVLVSVGPFGQV